MTRSELMQQSLNSPLDIYIYRTPNGWRYSASQGELFAAFGIESSFKDAWMLSHLACPAGGDVTFLLRKPIAA